MPRRRRDWRPAAAWAVIVAAVAAVVAILTGRGGGDSFPVAAQANGPAGAVVVDRGWRYRSDRRDVGVAQGWHTQRPTGRAVSLPWVPNATPVSGPGGVRNYRGSIG